MNSPDYVSAVLDEIALEGLDGIAHEGNYEIDVKLTLVKVRTMHTYRDSEGDGS